MCKCKICGNETKKGRQVCINCTSVKEVVHRGENASEMHKKRAVKHLNENSGLSSISWTSFFKRKREKCE